MRRPIRSSAVWAGAAVIALVGALGVASPASATHAWGTYHWARTGNPFTLQLGDNVSSDWQTYYETASSQWGESKVLDTRNVAGLTTGRRCRPTAGRVEVCNAAYGRNGWLGLASISTSGGHITQGTAKMNDTYFALAKYNTPEERADVMCQEIGHTLGLDHTSTDGSSQQTCMDYSTTPDVPNPNAHDYEQLATIYAHLDSTSTVAPTTASSRKAAATSGGGDGPAEWGRLTRASGRSAVYQRDLGGGKRTFTFVTWAEAPAGS